MPILKEVAERYHAQLPQHIRNYLQVKRGLSDAVIDKYQLGWDRQRIAIPITNRAGNVILFKLAKAPGANETEPKMRTTFGTEAELYGWDRALAPLDQVIVCEGEFDRLALESRGFAAVTSTAGALTFRKEWADALRAIPNIYICFDRDGAGEAGARRVAAFLPEAKIVTLPPEVGHAGDVSDFFVGLGKTMEHFDELLSKAVPLAEFERSAICRPAAPRQPARGRTDIDELKAQVRIEDWVSACLPLSVKGENYEALCPFHDDRNPSFIVFALTQTFHCFGCGAHGDVFTFLMRMRGINFAEAREVVRRSLMENGEQAA